ncbi:MAG TPA: hypothetical protein VMK84_28555, partial [Streptosporangiaceae bacterium]|nr:hypothetical protein [Streptosporangiaceae bacterium]
LPGVPGGGQRCNGDQAAVPRGQLSPGPDLAEQHVVGEADQARGEAAELPRRTRRLLRWSLGA